MAAHLGIDLGTTNTVVALADRGNYPVLETGGDEQARDAVPTLFAFAGSVIRTGAAAEASWDEPGFEVLPSAKRWLGTPEPRLPGRAGNSPGSTMIEELFEIFLADLRERILACPHLEGETDLVATVGVPAHANSLQRMRTLEAAERAGFRVAGLVNEPTAAALEYAQRHPGFAPGKARRHLAVYDLGGGTFDASVVRVTEEGFEVLRSEGIERLGGDDVDAALATLALARAGAGSPDLLDPARRHRLLRRCCAAKEAIGPSSRKVLVDLEGITGGEAAVPVADLYDATAPLVERTVATLAKLLGEEGLEEDDVDALLLVGGASQFPLVRRRLREVVGARLRVSPHPFASTAIGLAIQCERAGERPVAEKLSRTFGVWREADAGARRVFDPIFGRDTPLPPAGTTIRRERAYVPAHNVGHLRFEECAAVDADGQPLAPGTPWSEVVFPYDPAFDAAAGLAEADVVRVPVPADRAVRETYECDALGRIRVTVERDQPHLACGYLLSGPERVAPLRKPKGSGAAR